MPTDKKISELLSLNHQFNRPSVLVSSGTDYQFAFSGCLCLSVKFDMVQMFPSGSTFAATHPGKNGDVFINTSAGSSPKNSRNLTVVYTSSSSGSSPDLHRIIWAGNTFIHIGK